MAPLIEISPSPAMVLVDQGQTTVDVTVTYHSPGSDVEPIIWERLNSSDWNRRVIDLFSGDWQKTLKPADTYRVIMYDRADADPNVAI